MLSVEIVPAGSPPDVCPNIGGIQASLPDGMAIDSGGNCYTPTTPVTTDLCANISEIQTTLPNGYYRTSGGDCYAQSSSETTEPVDVCSNLDGVQTSVPDGYYLDESNKCVDLPTVTDECPNIPGAQSTIPKGMKKEDNACFTPAVATQKPTTPSSGSSDDSYLSVLPTFLRPPVKSIMGALPTATKGWLRSLPENTAEVVPFYIFILVALLALIPILQATREALFVRQISVILGRERNIAEEKDNFVALASHYLRTPLTLMTGGVETIVASNELTADQVAPLTKELNNLNEEINTILDNVKTNDVLKNIGSPGEIAAAKPVWRSAWFWGPIIGSIVLTIIANFLLVIVGGKRIGVTQALLHFSAAAGAFVILYFGVRNLYLQRRLRAEQELMMGHEKAIDEARNEFISKSTMTLKDALEQINKQRIVLESAPSASYFDEGYARIEGVLQKFLLLSQVQAGVERDLEVIDVHEAIDNLLVTYNTSVSEKGLTVTNATSPVFIRQNRMLFNFVLSSVLDNAIKFNQSGGSIVINLKPDSKMLTISVADNGIGVNSEKLEQLFKPFSRTTSAVEFSYEGLGFSLFLDKIIMDYTGGDIHMQSVENKGTELFITTPIAMNAAYA